MLTSVYFRDLAKELPQAIRSRLDRSAYLVQLLMFNVTLYALAILCIPITLAAEWVGLEDGIDPEFSISAALIVAPLTETLIFQKWAFSLLSRIALLRERRGSLIMVSATLFGLSHCYSPSYVVAATISGIVLMYIYMYYLPDRSKAFWSVAIVHCAHNATALFLEEFLGW